MAGLAGPPGEVALDTVALDTVAGWVAGWGRRELVVWGRLGRAVSGRRPLHCSLQAHTLTQEEIVQ